VFVLGGQTDRVLDVQAYQELARSARQLRPCSCWRANTQPDKILACCCCCLARLACSYYNTQAVVLPNTAHDVMLDTRWEAAAAALQRWLDETYPSD
jgi:hypothetical protein